MWVNRKIVVVGVGGVGGIFGGRLAENGYDVTFVARGDTLESMKTQGLIVESIDGDFTIDPVKVTDDPQQIITADLILICVKTPQVKEIADAIKPIVGKNTVILPLQNGMESYKMLTEKFGENRVLGGLCRVVSHKVGPGHIKHENFPPTVEFGEFKGGISKRVSEIKQLFDAVGIKTVAHEDVRRAMWIKLMFVAPTSGMGAVTRSPMGVYRSVKESRYLLRQIMEEMFSLGTKLGINLPNSLVENLMKGVDGLPASTTTSMQRDLVDGKPSELDSMIGTIVKMGKEHNIETPVTEVIYGSLLPMELKAKGKLEENSG